MSDTDQLLARVEDLERRLSFFKRVALCASVPIVLVFVSTSPSRQPQDKGVVSVDRVTAKTVDCRTLRVLDKRGRPVVLIENIHGGHLSMFSADLSRAIWARFTKGGEGVFSLDKRDGPGVVELRAREVGGALIVRSAKGHGAFSIAGGKAGECDVHLRNKREHRVLGIGIGTNGGGALELFDGLGENRRVLEGKER